MKAKQQNKTGNKPQPLSAVSAVLLGLAVLFLLPGILIFGWYGMTHLPAEQRSDFPAREITVSSGGRQCTLQIPAGKLTLRHPRRTAIGSTYGARAEVHLEQAPHFTGCTGGMANWNINLEAQTSFVSANVLPFASIRQPAVNRDSFTFEWTLTPEEPVPVYRSVFWLRVIVSELDQTVESWDMLVRDFPMENAAIFGQPTILWLIIGGFSLLTGLLILIIFLQKRRRAAD